MDAGSSPAGRLGEVEDDRQGPRWTGGALKVPSPSLPYRRRTGGGAVEARTTSRGTSGRTMSETGSPATLEQYSKDVSAFLVWAAEPHMMARKRIGFQVMIFLIVLAGLMYFTKKKVWSDVH